MDQSKLKSEAMRSQYWRRRVGQSSKIRRAASPKLNKYIPHDPTAPQTAFLLLDCLDAFYGGAGGGGKSDALLMAALQYVDVPGYAALLLRRTFPELEMQDGLIDRAHQWLDKSDAIWSARRHQWTFPWVDPPSTLTFGYLESPQDVERYRGPAFQFVGWDELTTFLLSQFQFLFSRVRRPAGMKVPLRVRGASNPGGVGHEWVKRRYLEDDDPDNKIFIRAVLSDNPHLDQESYARSLMELDPISRRQILSGDWTARHAGSMFPREWFPIQIIAPLDCQWVRYWDLAGTEKKRGNDPDWTAGAFMGKSREPKFYLKDMVRFQGTPGAVEKRILQTAALDGKEIPIHIEQEPGQSGVAQMAHYAKLFAVDGYDFNPDLKRVDKIIRANPVSSQAEAGNIVLINGPWVADYLDEMEAFPGPGKKDQVDATSGAFAQLTDGNDGLLNFMREEVERMKQEQEESSIARRS